LGVGNYTEQDIREAARAFTGWHSDDDEFDFDEAAHDTGSKTVFGKSGNWNGDDIVRFCLEKDCCARYLVRKFYRFFISEAETPPDSLLEPLADQFRKSDYDIAGLVRTILGSRHFFSEHAYRRRIKNPVELAVGSLLAVASPEALAKGQISQEPLIAALEAMGQPLFNPPNVKGWPGGKNWLNTSTVLARHNFVQQVASANLPLGRRPPANRAEELEIQAEEDLIQAENAKRAANRENQQAQKPRPSPRPNLDLMAVVRREKPVGPRETVRLLLDMFLQGEIDAQSRTALEKFIAEGKAEGATRDWRIRDAGHTIMTMPEFQLA
jgi:uncharacterized protein (DUF1800 family)